MAKKRMLINVSEDETRIALTENDVLVDLHVEQVLRGRTAGNIYRGTVVKVNPAFQAAFIDYGEKKNGFLSINDLHSALYQGVPGGHGKARIQSVLRRGQTLMVQVLKEGVGAKGAALTTNVALPGRYLVLSPYSDRSGVSRKIDESEHRTRLKEFLTGLSAEGLGVIVRTAGIDRSLTDLKKDFTTLRREWKEVQDLFKKTKEVGLIYREPDSVVRVLRDYFSEEVEEVWVDSPEMYQVALEYFKQAMPKFQKRLKLYIGDRSLFSLYKIEEKIEALDSSKVPLRSGGSIVITPTEALVSIDVNSGKSNQESDIEETALRTNMEAAEEIARQLRLRNLGGLIVVDFIDMSHKANQNKVVAAMTSALKHDKARTTIGSISQFGLLELSRQRIDMELSRGLRIPCENCAGTGHVPTVYASANTVLRKLREVAAQGGVTEIHGSLPLEHANFVLNHKREFLAELELEFGIKVHLNGDPNLPAGQPVRLEWKGAEPEAEHDADERETREETRPGRAAPEAPRAASADEEAGRDGRGGRRRRRRPRRGGREGFGGGEGQREPMAAGEAGEERGEFGGDQEEAWAAGESDDGMEELAAEGAFEKAGEREEIDELTDVEVGDVEAEPEETAEPKVAAPTSFHERRPDSAITLTHAMPTAFTLGRMRRSQEEIGARIAAGEAIFESMHREGETQEHETVLIPSVKRDDPLYTLAQSHEAGQVFFESTHRDNGGAPGGNGGSPSDPPAAGDSSEQKRAGGRRRGGRGRRKGPPGGGRPAGEGRPPRQEPAHAAPVAPVTPSGIPLDDHGDVDGNRIVPEADGNRRDEEPGARRRGPPRSRGGRSRRRRPPSAATPA